MSEFAGITLTWERAVAAAKNLPRSTPTQNNTLNVYNPGVHSDYLFLSLEDIFTITSRAIGYIAFISTMMYDLDNECPVSMSLLRHVIDNSELPDGQTLKKISDIILEKSCANGYVLLILHAQKFAGHLVEKMWSDEILNHLITAIKFNSGVTRLYAILSLESLAMTGTVMKRILSHQHIIQQLLNNVLLECSTILQLHPLHTFNSYNFEIPRKRSSRSCILDFLLFVFLGRKKTMGNCLNESTHPNKACTAQLDESSKKLWFTTKHIQYCAQWFLKRLSANNNTSDLKCIYFNGLCEVRNDKPFSTQTYYSFDMIAENTGSWYYEVLLLTDGIIHIGWANVESQCLTDRFYKKGLAFDTYRGWLLKEDTVDFPEKEISCQAGDVVGTLLDLKRGLCTFIVNDEMVEITVETSLDRVFPAISLAEHQHVAINYGVCPWFYPQSNRTQPIYKAFKKAGKSQCLEGMEEDLLCILCYSEPKGVAISPCFHNDFGSLCVKRLSFW